jgi:3',5'-cyclic AMP phosphodiesterase CpdA
MAEHTLTLLHLSDLHERVAERSSWRRRRVLGQAWEANLDALCEDGPYDLVCFTGDAAFAGQAQEFHQATEFFQALLDRLGLGWNRFFPVPGNHDIDRKLARSTWRDLGRVTK